VVGSRGRPKRRRRDQAHQRSMRKSDPLVEYDHLITYLFKEIRKFEGNDIFYIYLIGSLCVLVYGYFEESVSTIFREHTKTTLVRRRTKTKPEIAVIMNHISNLHTASMTKVILLAREIEPDWADYLENMLDEALGAAVDSVVNRRNEFAHGQFMGQALIRDLSLNQLLDYHTKIKRVVKTIERLRDGTLP
jgi:RiboL-PSP-HEPN